MQIVELHGGDYEHVLTLGGRYSDIDLRYVRGNANDIFAQMIKSRTYEACEFSLSNYLMLKARGAEWLSAVPVFPYRAFRHSTLYVRADSDIRSPSDLPGKRIGVRDYSMTAAVWTRGILADQYGVSHTGMQWVVKGAQRFDDIAGVTIETTEADLEDELLAGRIDVLLATKVTDDSKPDIKRRLRPVIADVRHAEEEYLDRFGIYPINHVVAVRADTLERLPQLPRILFEAYERAKADAYRRRLGTTLLPWGGRIWRDVFDRFGGDPLPYGLIDANRKVIERLASYLRDQGLIDAIPDIDRLFLKVD